MSIYIIAFSFQLFWKMGKRSQKLVHILGSIAPPTKSPEDRNIIIPRSPYSIQSFFPPNKSVSGSSSTSTISSRRFSRFSYFISLIFPPARSQTESTPDSNQTSLPRFSCSITSSFQQTKSFTYSSDGLSMRNYSYYSPSSSWVGVDDYIDHIGSVLRDGGWSESDISEMVHDTAPSSGFFEYDMGLLNKQAVLNNLLLQADRLSDSLRDAGWSSEEVSDAFGFDFWPEKEWEPVKKLFQPPRGARGKNWQTVWIGLPQGIHFLFLFFFFLD